MPRLGRGASFSMGGFWRLPCLDLTTEETWLTFFADGRKARVERVQEAGRKSNKA
jgi:hypothetical protein